MTELVKCPRCQAGGKNHFRNWCYLCDKEKTVSLELAAGYMLLRESGALNEEGTVANEIYHLRVDVGDLTPATPEEHKYWRNWFFPKSGQLLNRKKRT